jgi:two-component system NtrC family sensor kinase
MQLSWKNIRQLVRSNLRYKLFTLVLLPILLAMLATLGFTVYWLNNYARDNLYLKARTDLAQAQQAMQQVEKEQYVAALQQLADSYEFRAMFRLGNASGLARDLRHLAKEQGFAFVHITGELGNWLYEDGHHAFGSSKPTPLTGRAMRGLASAALEGFSADDLKREGLALPPPGSSANARGASAKTGQSAFVARALVLRAVCPITDKQGNVLAVLDGGVVLNNNIDVVNAVRDRIYSAGTLPEGGMGAVALLLGDTYVSSDIPALHGDNALDLHASPEMRKKVLENGETWVTRDRLGGQWYISGYTPIYDVQGQGIGVLHTAFLEAPFRHAYYWSAALLLLILLGLFGLSTWIAFRGAKRILKPVGQMMAVVRATQAGLEQRIGEIDSQDELRELARQFDATLDLLQQRNREIRHAADELEAKVEERTRELESRNADLKATVELLHQTQQQLVLAEKLAAVGELAAGVAHEIHNPTAVIVGNLDILASELGARAAPVQAEIDLIMQQTERIRHIVNRLLKLARPSRMAGEIREVDVNRLVENTLAVVRHVIKEKPVAIRTRLDAGRLIHIDPYDLEEVLINLVINASHAVSAGGIVELSTADWGRWGVVIRVRDDGVGIAPEALGRIFDPFFTTDPQSRTGLGLSVSYGLIRRFGGNITVESVPGRGSTFYVWLLRRPAPEAQKAPLNTKAAKIVTADEA